MEQRTTTKTKKSSNSNQKHTKEKQQHKHSKEYDAFLGDFFVLRIFLVKSRHTLHSTTRPKEDDQQEKNDRKCNEQLVLHLFPPHAST